MEEKKIKPKQYSHIDYEALLVYMMKRGISAEKALQEHGLEIARSTLIRNIEKMKKEKGRDLSIIQFYQTRYVPNMQKSKLPEEIVMRINEFEEKPVVVKNELDDLYNKLKTMNEIVEECGGNVAEAARRINSGTTALGAIKPISVQGLRKDIKYYEKTREKLEKAVNKEGEER